MSHKFHTEPVVDALEREADRAALLTGRGWSAAALGLSCPLRRRRSPAGDTDTASAPARSCKASLSGGAAGEPATARDLDRAAGARPSSTVGNASCAALGKVLDLSVPWLPRPDDDNDGSLHGDCEDESTQAVLAQTTCSNVDGTVVKPAFLFLIQ